MRRAISQNLFVQRVEILPRPKYIIGEYYICMDLPHLDAVPITPLSKS